MYSRVLYFDVLIQISQYKYIFTPKVILEAMCLADEQLFAKSQ